MRACAAVDPRPAAARSRTPVRRAMVLAAAVVVLAVAAVLVGAAPARAANAFVEVTPSTAQPGTRVNIRASCDQMNNTQATVTSEAFGRVIVRPNNGFLTGAVSIPGNRAPGTFDVTLTCQNGNTAHTTITIVNMSKPTQGPATGGGGAAGGLGGPVVLIGGLGVIALGAGLWLAGVRRRRAETGL